MYLTRTSSEGPGEGHGERKVHLNMEGFLYDPATGQQRSLSTPQPAQNGYDDPEMWPGAKYQLEAWSIVGTKRSNQEYGGGATSESN